MSHTWRNAIPVATGLLGCLAGLCLVVSDWAVGDEKRTDFDGQLAYGYLRQICALGPRISGTAGMLKQQAMLEEHFSGLGAKVEYQRFHLRLRLRCNFHTEV